MQSRWRSKGAWLALVSLIMFIMKAYFKVDIPHLNELVDLLFICATAWGIFNNPEKSDGF